MSLLARIVLLIAFATLAPAVVLGTHIFQERGREIGEATHSLEVLAKFAADNLDDKAKATVQLLHGLSRAPDLATQDKGACSAFLARVLSRYPQYTGLLTIMPNGDLHCDSLRSGRKLNLSGRDYFIEALSTREPAFDAVIGGLTGIGVLQVAYPVQDDQGTLKYVLLASLNLSEYAAGFTAAGQYPGMELQIWNRKEVLIARNPVGRGVGPVGAPLAPSAVFDSAGPAASGAVTVLSDSDGVEKVWALGVLPNSRAGGLRITLGIPRDVLSANADTVFLNALALLVGVSLLASLAAAYLAETSIRRPVRMIANIAKRVGAGESNARIGVPYPSGELGELMAVVDQTSVSVEAQRTEIETRSLDLQRANRTLRMLSGVNTIVVRARGRDELFKEACRVAVEDAGFLLAWIGLLEHGGTQLIPVASAGVHVGLQTAIANRVEVSDGSLRCSLAAQAISSRSPVVAVDSPTSVGADPGDPSGALRGGSAAFFPLVVADIVVGVLALYAADNKLIHEDELKRLTEVAVNIAFAIDHIEKEKKLDYLAHYDVLTGLANRQLLLGRLSRYMRTAVSDGHKLALFLIDLQRFRSINNTLGRPAGDALLRQVAEWLTRNIGDSSLLARIGGDHFAVILPRVMLEGSLAHLVEKSIGTLLRHPFRLNHGTYHVNAKVGVAIFPDHGMTADSLLANVDTALKNAKAGGNQYQFYTAGMTKGAIDKLALENQLRKAVEQEEFVLHYQPKIDLISGDLVGVEALIRWNDPCSGLVLPGRFIATLEETGLIREVGRWALRQAIADNLRWRASGLGCIRVSVNVSPLQLRHVEFVGEIERAVAVHPDAAAGLELEITESVVMDDVKDSTDKLRLLRAMNVKIAIDDFGTGFSSLSYLAKLPVDTLKIDRSFVVDMTSGPQGVALVSAIINLAHVLNLNVVAEGVETPEHARLLRMLECDEMQGYLISKPLPADLFESRFLSGRLLAGAREATAHA